jgi:chromosome segregation ATPase
MRASKSRADRVRLVAAALLIATGIWAVSPVHAEDDEVTRLRALLRDTVSSLRDTQDENAALTAKETELTSQLAEKQHELDTLKAQQAASASSSAGLTVAAAAAKQLQAQLDQTNLVLQKWQDGYNKAAAIARDRDAAARDFARRFDASSSELKQCAAKNDALEKLGEEMVGKIGKCSLGDFLGAHEPVTQIYKVRLEDLTDGFRDKLRDDAYPPK